MTKATVVAKNNKVIKRGLFAWYAILIRQELKTLLTSYGLFIGSTRKTASKNMEFKLLKDVREEATGFNDCFFLRHYDSDNFFVN